MDKHRLSLIVIGVFAIAILVGGWFVGVQPQLDRSSRANVQTASLMQTNDIQHAKNQALAAEDLKLEDYKRELAENQQRIPAARAQQELINQIDAAAAAAGVSIRSLTFDPAVSFAAPEDITAAVGVDSDFIGVPLTLSAEGERAALEAFAANVQNSARVITIGGSQFTGGEIDSLVISGATWVLMPTS